VSQDRPSGPIGRPHAATPNPIKSSGWLLSNHCED
jgi:hypothetical protein